ncbi:MAG: hypothetical protein AB1Z98_13800 [Nannocystaceae bacterium]
MKNIKNDDKEASKDKPAEVRKIVIKTAIRAGQGKNRYAAPSPF